MKIRKVEINRHLCIGCGVCLNACPGSFEMSVEGYAEFTGAVSGCIYDASEACPVDAISFEM